MNDNIRKNWETTDFPVFVVFNECKVFGVFFDLNQAKQCRDKNLDVKYPPMIQKSSIEGLKSFSYELEKQVEDDREPELIAFDCMLMHGTINSVDDLKDGKYDIYDAYITTDIENDEVILVIYKGEYEWYKFNYRHNGLSHMVEYKGIICIK